MAEISLDKLKIGFEIHAQIDTKQKLYCDCSTDYQSAEPNRNICSICIGLPGNKPMPVNKDALNAVIEVASMLGADIVKDENIFIQRKHYNYPDLPNGYQKTSTPIARNGKFLNVGIREVHLEDDPGRYDLSKGKVDYDRSGVPLVEIVTEPDIKSIDGARNFWDETTNMLAYTGKIRSEPGTIRSDTNISMGGERVEIKNINSATGVYHALQYEVKRQLKAFRRGRKIRRETRGFLEDKMITATLRTKETFADYRYIPDPDIPPIIINDEMIEEVRKHLKETPQVKERRFISQYKINPEQASILTSDLGLSNMYENVAKEVDPSLAASWLTTEVKGYFKGNKVPDVDLYSKRVIDLLKPLSKKEITPIVAKKIFKKVMGDKHDVKYYLSKELPMIGEEKLMRIVDRVVTSNESIISDYKSGKPNALNYLVGEIMKETKGTADPKKAYEMIKIKADEV